jgi:Sec-independent protein secretion pathway component TatC
MTRQRLIWLAIVVLIVGQCLFWFVASVFGWSLRDLMVGPGSPESARRTALAIAVTGATTINCAALLLFLIRPHGWGWIQLVAVQLSDVLVSLVWGFSISPDWWLATALGAITIVALYGLSSVRRSESAVGSHS